LIGKIDHILEGGSNLGSCLRIEGSSFLISRKLLMKRKKKKPFTKHPEGERPSGKKENFQTPRKRVKKRGT